jgi:magnesium chelatase family protein
MLSRHIRTFCDLCADCERLLERAMTQQGLSARAHNRILKVAGTIADIEDTPNIEPKHIAEAILYRSLARPHSLDLELALALSLAGSKGRPRIYWSNL